ncbi:MAG TPA: hypothetical protein DD422_05330, partial [Akkermansia sp.]|nr:hypothetical protein [Akkermansia sp.]
FLIETSRGNTRTEGDGPAPGLRQTMIWWKNSVPAPLPIVEKPLTNSIWLDCIMDTALHGG